MKWKENGWKQYKSPKTPPGAQHSQTAQLSVFYAFEACHANTRSIVRNSFPFIHLSSADSEQCDQLVKKGSFSETVLSLFKNATSLFLQGTKRPNPYKI